METNNKWREALEEIRGIACNADSDEERLYAMDDIVRVANAALSAPPRNCDVGSPEEQRERFAKFCRNCKRNRCGFHPKAQFIDLCAIAWAQMPYEAKRGGEE